MPTNALCKPFAAIGSFGCALALVLLIETIYKTPDHGTRTSVFGIKDVVPKLSALTPLLVFSVERSAYPNPICDRSHDQAYGNTPAAKPVAKSEEEAIICA